MIELELRGELSADAYNKLEEILQTKGKLIEEHGRVMYLIKGYEGFDMNPVTRQADIRLKNSSGKCEIVMKLKKNVNNSGREEIIIPLDEPDLKQTMRLFIQLGFSEAIRMERQKKIYEYENIEWSLVKAPKGINYFEAEIRVEDTEDLEVSEAKLREICRQLNLQIFSDNETVEFYKMLDEKVNTEVDLKNEL